MNNHYTSSKGLHLNYLIISDIIEYNSKVLDLGCASGDLLKLLKDKKNVQGRGVELDNNNVIKCIEKSLAVFQGNIDEGLKEYNNKSYDYVILNQTLQLTHRPDYVIQEMVRVGKKVVISFPNFAYWRIRSQLFFEGKMPKSKIIPFEWYNTPNIHLLTLKDFREFCDDRNIQVLQEIYMTRGEIKKDFFCKTFPNFFSEEVIFVVSKD